MLLYEGEDGMSYQVKCIQTVDEELNAFLFSLGCYEGEAITVISKKKSNLVIAVKDGRYNIDRELARLIEVN